MKRVRRLSQLTRRYGSVKTYLFLYLLTFQTDDGESAYDTDDLFHLPHFHHQLLLMSQGLDTQIRSLQVSRSTSLNMVVGTMLIMLRALMVLAALYLNARTMC